MTKTKTKQEYIDTIRKACISADESILDLVFGCKVGINKQIDVSGVILDKSFGKSLYYNYSKKEILVKDFIKDEIIGRKIGVAEVLVAIENKVIDKDEYQMTIYGELQRINTDTGEYIETMFTWNLKNDNIENQDIPTLKWLVDLLGNKN